jgi:hypothetical protein
MADANYGPGSRMDSTVRAAHLRRVRAFLKAVRTEGTGVYISAREAVFTDVQPADIEWLTDRVTTAEYTLGLSYDTVDRRRRLQSEGRTHWEDDDPSHGPHPYFTYFDVGTIRAVREDLRERLLVKLEAGRGSGPTTWGWNPVIERAWLSDTRLQLSDSDLREVRRIVAADLATLGLQPVTLGN